jgi:hypothetical protein
VPASFEIDTRLRQIAVECGDCNDHGGHLPGVAALAGSHESRVVGRKLPAQRIRTVVLPSLRDERGDEGWIRAICQPALTCLRHPQASRKVLGNCQEYLSVLLKYVVDDLLPGLSVLSQFVADCVIDSATRRIVDPGDLVFEHPAGTRDGIPARRVGLMVAGPVEPLVSPDAELGHLVPATPRNDRMSEFMGAESEGRVRVHRHVLHDRKPYTAGGYPLAAL